MAMVPLIAEDPASPEVREVFNDIRTTRSTDWINNFWRALANHPATLRRTWQSLKEVMAPGALDPLTKEMIYLAVSISNGCAYCTASHGADDGDAGRARRNRRNGQRDQPARRGVSRAGRREVRKSVLIEADAAGACVAFTAGAAGCLKNLGGLNG
jgi:AhpD family alkylhydroperoxidase